MDLTNVVVHCPTGKLAKKVLAKADDMGYMWITGSSFLEDTEWESFKEKTCYNIKKGSVFYFDWYKDNGFKIISAQEFLNEGKAIKEESIETLKKEKAILSLQIAVKRGTMDFSDYEYIKQCIEKYKEET